MVKVVTMPDFGLECASSILAEATTICFTLAVQL